MFGKRRVRSNLFFFFNGEAYPVIISDGSRNNTGLWFCPCVEKFAVFSKKRKVVVLPPNSRELARCPRCHCYRDDDNRKEFESRKFINKPIW